MNAREVLAEGKFDFGGWQLALWPPKVSSKTFCDFFLLPSGNLIIYYVLMTLGVPCGSLWGPWSTPRPEENPSNAPMGSQICLSGYKSVQGGPKGTKITLKGGPEDPEVVLQMPKVGPKVASRVQNGTNN